MGQETEFKYLIDTTKISILGLPCKNISQWYLSVDPARCVRVRQAGMQAYITIKGKSTVNAEGAQTCPEFEYDIPYDDSIELKEMAIGQIINKSRVFVPGPDGRTWEVDFFYGLHLGLVIAECEVRAGYSPLLPNWVTKNVSGDPIYSNLWLSQNPF